MGATKALGCLVFVLFSGYVLLQAERGRRFLVGGEFDAPVGETAAQNPALSEDEQPSTSGDPSHDDPFWKKVGINVFLVIGTFLCYDLVVTNILVFSLATDGFFLRAPLRVLLCGMVGVLAAASWYELPSLMQDIQGKWWTS